MNKGTLVDAVARRTGVTKSDTKLMIETVFEVMVEELEKGRSVIYPGFGTLHVGKIKPHERVNPATGEMEMRGGTRKVSFRSAGELKARMNPNA